MYKIVALVCVTTLAIQVDSHGRFMKPPNRSSVWRVPEFANQNPPKNYNDNQLFCGGIHQKEVVGGNCGVCGDAIKDPAPRENEIGGKFYKGIITGKYTAGSVIDVEVDLTMAHKGYMEWRLCNTPLNGGERQECFNRYLLQRADGKGSKLPVDGTGWYRTKLRLPSGVKCSQCVIQWNYRGGNNWGDCGNGKSAVGCGPQETFRGCSDVSIQ